MIHAHAAAGKNTNIAMAVKAGFDRRVASVPLMRNGKSGMRESEAAYAKQKAAQLVKLFAPVQMESMMRKDLFLVWPNERMAGNFCTAAEREQPFSARCNVVHD